MLYEVITLHFARMIFYFLCLIVIGLIIALISLTVTGIHDLFKKHERKVRIKLLISEKEKGTHFEEIKKLYIEKGFGYLNHISKLVNDQDKLEYTYFKKHLALRKKIDRIV